MASMRLTANRRVLLLLALCAIIMRFPFFYETTQMPPRFEALTYYDEALFMYQGREALSGHLPFVEHWDNRPPMHWYAFGVLMLLSGGNLTLFRILGALLVAVTGYVLYRTLADNNKHRAGISAGLFYVLFASTMPAGQSVMSEHVTNLPFALLVYGLLNPRPSFYYRLGLAGLFSLCCMLLTNYVALLPFLALIFPAESPRMDWKMRLWRSGKLLTEAMMIGFIAWWLIYAAVSLGDVWMNSLFKVPLSAGRQNPSWKLPFKLAFHLIGYICDMLGYYASSRHWLMVVLAAVFAGKYAYNRYQKRPVEWMDGALLVLFMGIFASMFLRGGMKLPHIYYILSALPVLCLMIGRVVPFGLGRNTHLIVAIVMTFGVLQSAQDVLRAYGGALDVPLGYRQARDVFYSDPQYRLAERINADAKRNDYLYVCREYDMLYILTGSRKVNYFLFDPFLNMPRLYEMLNRKREDVGRNIWEKAPSYIVAPINDPCLKGISKQLEKFYRLQAAERNLLLFQRKEPVTPTE